MNPNLVLVTGMHRSGTSVAARAVMACGYAMGPNLMPGSRDNPKGFFEDLELVAINDALMAFKGASWNTATGAIYETNEALTDRMSKFLDGVCEWGAGVALKDPRFCITYPIWTNHIKTTYPELKVSIVGSVRNPLETLQSVMLRDGMSKDATVKLWKFYNNGLLDFMMQFDYRYMTIYEKFLREPMQALESLNHFLRGNLDLHQAKVFSEEFMTESLHRHKAPMPTFEDFDREFAGLFAQLYANSGEAVGIT